MSARHARPRRVTLLTALLAFAGLFLATAPPTAPAAPSVATSHPYGPYTESGYDSSQVCIENHLVSTIDRPGDTANAFEPGVNTGYREGQNGCWDFPYYQRMNIDFYSAADGGCVKLTASKVADNTPSNHHKVYIWSSETTVWINQYYASCRDSQFDRDRNLSKGMAVLFGLLEHCSGWATPTVSDRCQSPLRSFAQNHDKLGIMEKYNYV
jgi:hypothetical protein